MTDAIFAVFSFCLACDGIASFNGKLFGFCLAIFARAAVVTMPRLLLTAASLGYHESAICTQIKREARCQPWRSFLGLVASDPARTVAWAYWLLLL